MEKLSVANFSPYQNMVVFTNGMDSTPQKWLGLYACTGWKLLVCVRVILKQAVISTVVLLFTTVHVYCG